MTETNSLDPHTPSVAAHLSILQGIIVRMAGNSSAAKAWCITIVSAVLVLTAEQGEHRLGIIALAPTLMFLVLDSFYLSLERKFRENYNGFVAKLHSGQLKATDLFLVKSQPVAWNEWVDAFLSTAIWPFYIALILTIGITQGVMFLV